MAEPPGDHQIAAGHAALEGGPPLGNQKQISSQPGAWILLGPTRAPGGLGMAVGVVRSARHAISR